MQQIRIHWLQDDWDPELSLVEWRKRLAEAGWATPTWPTRLGGRGLPASAASIVSATLAEFGAVGPPEGVGMSRRSDAVAADPRLRREPGDVAAEPRRAGGDPDRRHLVPLRLWLR